MGCGKSVPVKKTRESEGRRRLEPNSQHLRWWWQRRWRGWDDRDLFSLDYTILEFALPRLREFAKCPGGIPTDFIYGDVSPDEMHRIETQDPTDRDRRLRRGAEEWRRALEKMIRGLELQVEHHGLCVADGDTSIHDPASAALNAQMEEGTKLFFKHFFALWN